MSQVMVIHVVDDPAVGCCGCSVQVRDLVLNVLPADVDGISCHGNVNGLEFRHVSVAYPGAGHPVLDDVSFRVEPGETTAIIGSTGAGKTTIVNLITRLIDATEGTVLMNGVDVRRLAPELLWGRVGYVPQRAYLFSGTVAQPALRTAGRHRVTWGALEIAGAGRAGHARWHGARSHRAAQRVGRPAPAAGDRVPVVRPDIYVFDDARRRPRPARLRAALAPR
jgi:ATP-binding cassette subfamily B protein